MIEEIRHYWDTNPHDIKVASSPIGSKAFFNELSQYHYDKLSYLPNLINFSDYRGKTLLEIGCGLGIDLVRFAKNGAKVTGIDLSQRTIQLAKCHFDQNGLSGNLLVADGESMEFPDSSYDVVYAHGVIQYTQNNEKMISEIHRVLKVGGHAIMTVYNRLSWLNLLSRITNVEIEHIESPVLRKFSIGEFRKMLRCFDHVEIIVERFPLRTRLHQGIKASIYNEIFVRGFNIIPRRLVRRFGWHIIAKAVK